MHLASVTSGELRGRRRKIDGSAAQETGNEILPYGGGMVGMKCPYLLERALLTCAAVRFTYLPSMREISDFCTVYRHAECPLYRAAMDGADEPVEFDRWPLRISGT